MHGIRATRSLHGHVSHGNSGLLQRVMTVLVLVGATTPHLPRITKKWCRVVCIIVDCFPRHLRIGGTLAFLHRGFHTWREGSKWSVVPSNTRRIEKFADMRGLPVIM